MEKSNYSKFALMLTASFIVMYTVMYLNVDQLDHIFLNINRFYMTVLMVAPMAIIMLFMMKHMYDDRRKNNIITITALALFLLAFSGLRYQAAIGDIQYMKAMIPHHSSAILTSQEAAIEDPEVKKLAEEIIKTQKEEIALMKQYIERLEQ